MSIFGDITGLIQGNSAAGQVASQAMNAEQGVIQATQSGQSGIQTGIQGVGTAAGNGVAGINGAVGNANTNVNAAGQTAIGGVNAATGQANTTLSGLETQLGNNENPYLAAGSTGINQLSQYASSNPQFNFNPTSLSSNPELQFLQSQGANAVQNSSAAQGSAQGGATANALQQNAENIASTYEGQMFNQAQSQFQTNQNTTLSNLSALTNAGETANAQNNTTLSALGGQQAANTINAGTYAGNTNTTLAQYLGSLGLQGATSGGALGLQGATTQLGGEQAGAQFGLQGATQAGNYALDYGQAQAAGTLGTGNAIAGLGSDLGTLLMGL